MNIEEELQIGLLEVFHKTNDNDPNPIISIIPFSIITTAHHACINSITLNWNHCDQVNIAKDSAASNHQQGPSVDIAIIASFFL